MRPVEPSDLYTVESLQRDTQLPKDTIYDLVRDDEVLGRPLGFKLGRRWFVHPDDWNEFVARLRRAGTGDLPPATPPPARQAS
jgi:hypothetical protein